MRLQTRLRLAAAIGITSVATSIGAFAIYQNQKSDLAQIDSALNSVTTKTLANTADPLSEALLAIQDTKITLALLSFNNTVFVIRGEENLFRKTPAKSDLLTATKEATSISTPQHVRIRAVKRPDGEFIILASSLVAFDKKTQNSVQALVIFVTIASIGGMLLIGRLVRKDVGKISVLIQHASNISRGETRVEIEPRQGNSEIDQLSRALNRMIYSLKASVELERQTHARMQEFLGDASHELRTPLTVIKGYVEILEQDPNNQNEPQNRYFDRVTNEIARMESLINDLLLLAELGDRDIQHDQVVNLSQLVELQVHDLRALQSNRPVEFSIEPEIQILGNGSLLEQLLANVFSNIRRHTQDSDHVLVILRKDQSRIVLNVEDSGPGVPDSYYATQDQHFKRFDPSRSRDSGGSGLGMSIISAIVRQHHGTLTLARSDLGGLSTTITFPVTGRFDS